MLQHRLFNMTPNMLEVGHPKRSSSSVRSDYLFGRSLCTVLEGYE